MNDSDRLDQYHFYEREWDSYDELMSAFEWQVPDSFNLASYICDRWAEMDESRDAVYADDGDDKTETYSFQDIQRRANRLANYLSENGITRGDRVGINARQRPQTLISHIAVWKLGAVSVPLSKLFGTEGLSYRISDSACKACIVGDANISVYRDVVDDLDTVQCTVTIGDIESTAEETPFSQVMTDYSSEHETVETDAEDDAIIIYSSGTTGSPKGVVHAHRVLLGNLPLYITTFCNMELNETDVFWTPSEWAWVATLFDVVFPSLFYGRPIVAYTADKQFNPHDAMEIIERYEVSNFFAPPTALRMMRQMDNPEQYTVDSVRCIPSGGESLGEAIRNWAADLFDGAVVQEAYGQTEANMIVGDCLSLFPTREERIGRAGPGHEVLIVDPETAEPITESGTVGEIAVAYEDDPVCFKRYLNKPEKTENKIAGEYLLTEDLGEMDDDGYLRFVSRKDDVIISSGYRIGPIEIEEELEKHPAVADVAVIGVPDETRGEIPKAFIVVATDHAESDELKADLREYVRNQLAQYEYPREIEFRKTLPKTNTGKIKRNALE